MAELMKDESLVEGTVVRLEKRSILFQSDETGEEAFVPFSLVRDWHFLRSGSRDGSDLSDLVEDDYVALVVPKWLARKEGLV